MKGAVRFVGKAIIPCNWLQIMENSVDPTHAEWLHGRYYEFLKSSDGVELPISQKHERVQFDEFPYGIIKRRIVAGGNEDSEDWKTGHPLVFPNILLVGGIGYNWAHHTFQYRVPIDNMNTLHFWYHAFVPPEDAAVPERLFEGAPMFEPPLYNEDGEFLKDYIYTQDIMAWVTQGKIADRTRERLGAGDTGLIKYRSLLHREAKKALQGADTLGTIRDPNENQIVALPLERGKYLYANGLEPNFMQHNTAFSPVALELIQLMKDYDTVDRSFKRVIYT